MNERTRELLSQADVHYEVMPKDTVYEKFAELIVRECADIASGLAMPTVALRIKEHFGVEE